MKYRIWDKRKISFANTLKEIESKDKKVIMKYVGRDALKQKTYVFDIIQIGDDLFIIMNDTDPYIKGLKNSKTMGNIFKGIKI